MILQARVSLRLSFSSRCSRVCTVGLAEARREKADGPRKHLGGGLRGPTYKYH